MNNLTRLTCLLVTCLFFSSSFANEVDEKQTKEIPNNSILIFEGKVSCSLSRAVPMPFTGTFTDIRIIPGQSVKKDETIAQYTLEENRAIQIGRELLFNELDDIRRHLELEKQNIIRLERTEKELKRLTAEKLSPQYTLEALQTELRLTRAYVSILTKRSTYAHNFADKALKSVRKVLGDDTIISGQIPEIVKLKSPISGIVLSLHPLLRENSLLPEGTIIAQIGTMDTMLIHALVYERDVIHLNIGDRVTFFPDSLPKRHFPATITSISWTPATTDPDLPSYYQIEMTIDNGDFELRAGFKGRVEYAL